MTLDILTLSRRSVAAATDAAAMVEEIARSFMDTLAVAHAGRNEPVLRKLAALYGAEPAMPEHQALFNATAAHALDYDDLQFASVTHVSAVIVPALIAAAHAAPSWPQPRAMASAYLAGLDTARQVGTALGPAHYAAGWHATSTLGPLAAASAVARLWQLPLDQTRDALALATCQASGTQRSFGSMAKPLQAGLAASAGLRAAAWARQGISGPEHPFGAGGFETLYGGRHDSSPAPDDAPFLVDVGRKAYPCCYCAQRLVAAALSLRQQLQGVEGGIAPQAVRNVTIHAQEGTLLPLRITQPRDGNEAKFCADYVVAAALLDGGVGLRHFEAASLQRADLAALRGRIRVLQHGPRAGSIEDGVVWAQCELADGRVLQGAEIKYFPGSTQAPLTEAQLEAKLLDCHGGNDGAVQALKHTVRRWLGLSA
ncbi:MULTISPECIES: MmgE/PrpD family protein [unclassified Achromobacter]|uniref:MmgE/PrpD family protein n=1 Tax=unclassified Achromobacter TaxID=2626865 RepID=UPI000B519930|nr:MULTISPECIES: MmgE/PrpD family protein [unclassified Achromobacter]OWT71565.1 MmgE/PrpD family protein [Achromobacter sp. HZ34]OWT73222.1 MmgE/PrpD family protein [Achromobacter sp. HZ28]